MRVRRNDNRAASCALAAERALTVPSSSAGPILASSLGCRVLDVGAPQLAMHSIREMCGTEDIAHAYQHFCAFFERFSAIDSLLSVDDLPPAAILGSIEDPPCSHVN